MALRRLTVALSAAAAMITLAIPASALAATGADGAAGQLRSTPAPAAPGPAPAAPASAASAPAGYVPPSHTARPAFSATKARCHQVSSASAGTERCTQLQRLPLKDLSAAQWAQRQNMASSHPKPIAPRAGPAAQATLVPPSQCNFSGFEYALTGVSHPDRFTSCADTLWVASNWEVTSTPPFVILQGIFFWEDQQWTSYSATSGSWTHGMLAMGYTDGAAGNLSDGISGTVYSGCFLAQGICTETSLTTPDPQQVSLAPAEVLPFGWDEADTGPSSAGPGGLNTLDPYLGVTWEIENTAQPTQALDVGNLAGRCDSQATSTDGCVDEAFIPTLSLSLARYGSSAAMIQWAQFNLSGAWGLQGVGAPLHRLTDSILSNNNREVICDSSFVANPAITAALAPYGDTDSCDEYPFASSYESGAMVDGVTGSPKPYVTTGANCAQVTAVQTGTSGTNEAADWNAVTVSGTPSGTEPCVRGHIPGLLNSLAGSAYSALITTSRLISKDPFWVAVTA